MGLQSLDHYVADSLWGAFNHSDDDAYDIPVGVDQLPVYHMKPNG